MTWTRARDSASLRYTAQTIPPMPSAGGQTWWWTEAGSAGQYGVEAGEALRRNRSRADHRPAETFSSSPNATPARRQGKRPIALSIKIVRDAFESFTVNQKRKEGVHETRKGLTTWAKTRRRKVCRTAWGVGKTT